MVNIYLYIKYKFLGQYVQKILSMQTFGILIILAFGELLVFACGVEYFGNRQKQGLNLSMLHDVDSK